MAGIYTKDGHKGYTSIAYPRPDRHYVTPGEYAQFHARGFLVARSLVSPSEVTELLAHYDAYQNYDRGDLSSAVVLEAIGRLREGELEKTFKRSSSHAAQGHPDDDTLLRMHMLHRVDPTIERFFLHRRVLDCVEALIGPDVSGLQSMAFFNPSGHGGQGWHQDAAYITTYPETLIGSWLALDHATVENGCLRVADGSCVEPIYPERLPDGGLRGNVVHAQGALAPILAVENTSHLDDESNTLSTVAKRYPEVAVEVAPGDVIFFHSHLLHRSYPNMHPTKSRRAFVCHYANARSYIPWNGGSVHRPYDRDGGNAELILARGATHLPFALPAFNMELGAQAQGAGRSPRL